MDAYWWIAIAIVVAVIIYLIYSSNKTDVATSEAEVIVVDTETEQPTEQPTETVEETTDDIPIEGGIIIGDEVVEPEGFTF